MKSPARIPRIHGARIQTSRRPGTVPDHGHVPNPSITPTDRRPQPAHRPGDYHFTPPTDAGLAARCQNCAPRNRLVGSGLDARGRDAPLRRRAGGEPGHDRYCARRRYGRMVIAAGEQAAAARSVRRWCDRAPASSDREFSVEMMPTLRVGHQLVPYRWSAPSALEFRWRLLIDAIPALIAGCAVIIKPAK